MSIPGKNVGSEILDSIERLLDHHREHSCSEPSTRQLIDLVLNNQLEILRGQHKILNALTEARRFTIGTTRNEDKMDFQIFDDGKGVTYTATPDKPLLAGEVPTWAITAGDATALVLAPSADGLSCVGTLPSPAKDATGIVATLTLVRNDGVTITDDADPVDIIPNPNGEPGSFTITEAAN